MITKPLRCRLCKHNYASPIKSHIFSYFFIKSLINPPGEVKRNNSGRSFSVSNTSGATAHIERIPQKDFEELFGTAVLSEVEIEKLSMDPYSQSYILCSFCESTRIKIIEDYFNNNVFSITNKNQKSETHKGVNIFIPEANNYLIKLFILSLIWRASLTNFDDFKLPHLTEENLRNILDTSLGQNLQETIRLASQNKDSLQNEAIFIATSEEFKEKTRNHISIDSHKDFIRFEVNEYTICYFLNPNIIHQKIDLKGVENFINDESINYMEESFKVTLLDSDFWGNRISAISQQLSHELYENIVKEFKNSFFRNNRNPSFLAIQLAFSTFREELTDNNIPIGLKYDEKRITSLIRKYTNG